MEYQGKTAVVTGAASGIGLALAVELAQRGTNVAISDVNMDGLDAAVAQCGSHPGRVKAYKLDVADRAAFLEHATEVVADFGEVNLVVNNAGVSVTGLLEDMSFEDLDWILGINLNGVINGSKAFLPSLIASGDGHLVNLSSVFGLLAPPTQGAYATAKFAVRGFTEVLRQEMIMQHRPVTVHSVHPGGVKTNIARNGRYSTGSPAAGRSSGSPESPESPESPGSPGSPDSPDAIIEMFDKVARTRPSKAALAILRGVDRNKARILVGPDARVLAAIPRIFGSSYEAAFARAGARRAR